MTEIAAKTKRNRRTTMPKYTENPFLAETVQLTTTKTKTVFTKKIKDDAAINMVNALEKPKDDGEWSFCYRKEVDTNEFVKLYAEGLSEIMDLTSAGSKVFRIIYGQLYGLKGQDKTQIILNYAMLTDLERKKCAESTFQRGIKDCIKHRLIAQSVIPSVYFVNPSYIYNGSRIGLVKAYVNREREEAEKILKNLPAGDPPTID